MEARKAYSENATNQLQKRNDVQTKIKLCGYLKKKRNKMGGWRKMWFVLQDKLLLSYRSEEEYENKLVSFKDVVYLVPGTVVRPLGGFRFTIETTSHTIYTFHCDDRLAYREWISMLLVSIAAQDNNNASSNVSIIAATTSLTLDKKFDNISLNNIPPSTFGQNRRCCSTSCMSVNQLGTTVSSVRLPIAQNTAKILERNGTKNSMDTAATNYKNVGNSRICACLERNKEMEKRSQNISVMREMTGNKKASMAFADLNSQGTSINKSVVEAEVNQSNHRDKVTEPVYAIIDLKDKYARREMRQRYLTARRCSSYESVLQNLSSPEETKLEAKRDKKGVQPTKILDEPYCKIDSIYEDAEQFSQQICNEESIYEPINLSKISKDTSFFDYFNRLKINRIHQVNWFRTKYPDCKCSKQTALMDTIHKSSSRKSIKERMRKLCFKEFQPTSLYKHNQAVGEIPSEKFKIRWKSIRFGSKNQKLSREAPSKPKRSKSLFGSLPHLKKSRISLFSNQHFKAFKNESETENKSKK